MTPHERCSSFGGSKTTTDNTLYSFNGIDTRFLGAAIKICPSTPRRPTHCCRPQISSRNLSSIRRWSLLWQTGPWRASQSSTPPAAQVISYSAPSTGYTKHCPFPAPGLGTRGTRRQPSTVSTASTSTPSPSPLPLPPARCTALHAAGDSSIEQKIGYTPHTSAAGDSLLWGAPQQA